MVCQVQNTIESMRRLALGQPPRQVVGYDSHSGKIEKDSKNHNAEQSGSAKIILNVPFRHMMASGLPRRNLGICL